MSQFAQQCLVDFRSRNSAQLLRYETTYFHQFVKINTLEENKERPDYKTMSDKRIPVNGNVKQNYSHWYITYIYTRDYLINYTNYNWYMHNYLYNNTILSTQEIFAVVWLSQGPITTKVKYTYTIANYGLFT